MALRNGEIDACIAMPVPSPATMASSITGVEHVEPGMSDNTGSYMIMFGFRKGPTDDLNFRKAVTLSLDYELLAAAIGGEDAQVPGWGSLRRRISAMMRRCPSWNRIWRQRSALDEAATWMWTETATGRCRTAAHGYSGFPPEQ